MSPRPSARHTAAPSWRSREDGYTLPEALVVAVIIIVLAAIAIPVFFSIQKSNAQSTTQADVTATVQNIRSALFYNATASSIKGYLPGATVTDPSGGVGVRIVKTRGDETIIITAPVNDGTSPVSANTTGDWTGYEVTGTTSKAGGWWYTYNSTTGKYYNSDRDQTNNAANNAAFTTAPSFSTSSLPNALVNTGYSFQVQAAGSPTPNYTGSNFPAGLAISSTGVITGTPTAAGSYTVTITATNSVSTTSKAYQLVVQQEPAFTTDTLPDANAGANYSATVTASGFPTPTFTATGLPAGLTISPSGVISGTATTGNTYSVTVTASNAVKNVNKTYTLNVNSAPNITTTGLSNGVVGQNYSATLNSTGYPSPTWSAGTLPAGISLSTDGKLTGNPTTAGTYSLTFTVTNTNGTSSATLPLTIQSAPVISTTSLPDATLGQGYSAAITATGSPAPTFSATGLAPGLSISSSSGTISGTPTASGSYAVIVTATNSVSSASKTYTLMVASPPAITTTTLPAGKVGSDYSTKVLASGYPSPSFTATNLPGGLSIDSATGIISGSPTDAGNATISVTATNASGNDSRNFSLVINQATKITTQFLPDATANTSYSATVNAVGYPVPSFTATNLPNGLNISTSGTITGTPTATGAYTFTVTAANGQGSDSQTYTISVNSAVVINTTTLNQATVGVFFSQTIDATGYPAPTFDASGLPAGLNIDSVSGKISGTPTTPGNFNVKVTASNTSGSVSTQLTLLVNQNVSITTTTVATGTVGSNYYQGIDATGYPTPTFSATGLPVGLSIDSNGGFISGTPTTAGTYSVKVTAANNTNSDSKTYALVIYGPPVINTGSLPDAQLNIPYAQTISAGGYEAPVFSATGLPKGLTLDGSTGSLTGTVTDVTQAGAQTVTVTATNSQGSTTQTYTLNVNQTPTITTTSLPNASNGQPYSVTVTATGYPALSWSASGLPAGLSIDAGTGIISGSANDVPGTYTVSVSAVNVAGVDTKTYSILLSGQAKITTTSLPNANVGTAYTATVASDGFPSPTFTSTALPAGLSLNASTGVISGTPTAEGSYPVTVTATNIYGTDSRSYTLLVTSTPVITTASLPTAKVGTAYSTTVNATGYPTPTFAATGLPTGLSISNAGVVSGTPTGTAGSYTVTVTATNSAGSGTKAYTLILSNTPTITTTTVANGVVGTAYSATIATTGYPAPTFAASNLPDGLSINTTTGVISGTPTTAGASTFTVTVTNISGSATQTYSILISSVPVITTTNIPGGANTVAYSTTINATGYPTPTFAATGLPTGLSISTSGVISGTPVDSTGTYTVTVTATNVAGSVSKSYALVLTSTVAITTATLPSTPAGAAYYQTVNATGTPAPTFTQTGLPAGLSINANTGVISGAATTAGTYTVKITATNANGADVKTYNLVVTNAASINTATLPNGNTGSAYNYTIPVSGSPTPTVTLATGTLPAGLTLSSAGVLSGTPTGTGDSNFSLTATNSNGTSTQAYRVNINPAGTYTVPANVVNSLWTSYGAAGVGTDIGAPLSNAGALATGGTLQRFTWGAIYYNPTTAAYFFVPNAMLLTWGQSGNETGSYGYPIADPVFTGTTMSQQFTGGTLTASTLGMAYTTPQVPAVNNAALPAARQNVAYTQALTYKGSPSPTFSASGLPTGLAINSTSGVISGAAATTGNYAVTISVSNSAGVTSNSYTLVVSAVPVITTAVAPSGVVGAAYSFSVTTTGFPAPTYTVTSGAIPAGTTLNATTGVISGTPTVNQNNNFTITATNAYGSASQAYWAWTGSSPSAQAAATMDATTTNLYNAYGGSTGALGPVLSGQANYGSAIWQYFKYGNVIENTSTGMAYVEFNNMVAVHSAVNYTPIVTSNATVSGNTMTQVFGGTTLTAPAAGLATYIPHAPLPNNYALAPATSGTAYSQQISIDATPSATTTVTGLPTGLVYNTASGYITGTTNVASGTYAVTVSPTAVVNGSNVGYPQTYTLTVQGTPVITTAVSPSGVVGAPYSFQITTTSYPAATFAVTSGAIPAGTTLNTATGLISGTPTSNQNNPFTITATNSLGSTSQAYWSWTGSSPSAQASTTMDQTTTNLYNAYGASTGALGPVLAPQANYGIYSWQYFKYGNILENNSTGMAYAVFNNIVAPFAAANYPTAPTGTATISGGTMTQVFGTNTYSASAAGLGTISPRTPTPNNFTLAAASINTAYSQQISIDANPAATTTVTGLPTGLTYNTASGFITGTPTVAGSYSVTVSPTAVINGTTYGYPQTYTLNVNGAPVITNTNLKYAVYNAAYSQRVTTTGFPNPTFTVSSGALPTGLSLNATTGVISGTPTAANSAGLFTITATNSISSASQTYYLNVGDASGASYTITDPVMKALYNSYGGASGYLGNVISNRACGATTLGTNCYQFVEGGLLEESPTPYGNVAVVVYTNARYLWYANGFETGSATAYGVPMAAPTGAGTATLTQPWSAKNMTASGLGITENIQLPAVTTWTLNSGAVGTAYSQTLTSVGAGTVTYGATGLPSGLSLNASTGIISGTPTLGGSYTVNLTATNSVGSQTTAYTLNVTQPAAITSATMPNGMIGSAYSYTIPTNGYPNPTFAVASGSLPTGLSLNTSTGVISGTPTATGDARFTITATNTYASSSQLYQVAIAPSGSGFTLPTEAATAVWNSFGATNTLTDIGTPLTGQITLAANNGALQRFTWGNIYYNPNVKQYFYVFNSTLAVWNTSGYEGGTYGYPVANPVISGNTITQQFTGGTLTSSALGVATLAPAAPVFNTTSLAAVNTNTAYSQAVSATGYPLPTYSATGLPSGLSMSASGVISGTASTLGAYTVTVTATNSAGTTTKTYTMNVYTGPVITTTSLPGGAYNTAYSTTVNATGNPTPTFTATGLPAGLTISSAGVISGTPTLGGSYTVAVTATNPGGTATQSFALIITQAPQITTTSVPNVDMSTAYAGANNYSTQINAIGYPAPSFSRTGNLPGDNIGMGTLNLSSSGVLAGTSQKAGYFPITVKATNSFGTSTQAITVGVQKAVTFADPGAEYQGTNPDNQSGGSYGTYYNPNTAYVTDQKHSGNYAYKISTTTQGYVQGVIACTHNAMPYPAYSDITISMWVMGTPGETWAYGGRIDQQENLSATNGYNGYALTTNGGWQQITVNYNSSYGTGGPTNNICIQIHQTSPSAGKYLYTDDLSGVYVPNGVNAQSLGDPGAENQSGSFWNTYYGPATAYTTEQRHSGNYSFKITTNGGNPQGIIAGPNNTPIAAGSSVQVCMWVTGTAGVNWNVAGRQNGPYNEGMGSYVFQTTGIGTWQQICVYYTSPAYFVGPWIQIRQNDNTNAGVVLYADDLTDTYN